MKTIVTEVTANPSVRIYHTNVGITEVVLEIPKSAAGNSKWKKFMKPTVGNVLDNILLIDGVVAVRASYYSIDVQIGKAFAWEPIEMTILFELSQLLKGDTGEEVGVSLDGKEFRALGDFELWQVPESAETLASE